MALEEEIVEWAQGCPAWHRHVLRRLAHGEALGPDDYKAIAARLAEGDPFDGSTFALDDMPGGRGNGEHQSVRLVEIREVANVNALVPDQTLTVCLDGMTVVYGDNASGKSGYARLAKRVVRARHHEDILTNVFTDRAGGAPTADLTIDVDGEQRSGGWPDDPLPELGQISFFDSACSAAYISSESEITYRPSALFVLDGLIRACDGVRVELDSLLGKNTSEARPLPDLAPETAAADFVRKLSSTTTTEHVDEAMALPPDVEDRIAKLTEEELRLRATDPAKERARLQTLASKYQRVRNHMTGLADGLGEQVAVDLAEKLVRARDTAAAAELASSQSFEGEPLSGVGSGAWRTLWDAARAYSETECYDGQHFPFTGDGARCVLCHQDLGPDASDRLRRFDVFVEDRTQQEANAARTAMSSATSTLRSIDVSPPDVELMLADLEADDADIVTACRDTLASATARRNALLSAVDGAAWADPEVAPPAPPLDRLGDTVARLQERAASIDSSQFTEQLTAATTDRVELESRRALAAVRDDVLQEIARRARRIPLDAAKQTTDTSRITRKSTELTRSHVTSLVRDRFTRESDRLRLERVTLEDHGGQKGQLRHRPAFVGAVQPAALPQVLSEGEQTALGLAGFFTEVHFDQSRSAILLDDPVCSLDHVRREYVANRLAELAEERQVIVFTHDISFVADLRRAADTAAVAFTERSVVRRGNEPGVCQDSHPWKSKDVKARLAQLDIDLARIKKAAPDLDSETYEKEVAEWAGSMSETWERAVNLEVVGKVVDRTTLEVRPKMFRILAKITEDDDKQFQESYARCSKWARRHDKSPEMNYVAPTLDEMADELATVRSWFDRVRRYGD